MEPQVPTKTTVPQEPSSANKRNTRLYIRLGLFIFTVLAIAAGALWLRSAINTYRNAEKYKKSYELLQQELRFCNNPTYENEKDPAVIVRYCDEVKSRFKSIEVENK